MPVSIFHGMIISLEYQNQIPYIVVNYKDQLSYYSIEGDFIKGFELPKLQASCIEAWAVIEKEAIKVNLEKISNGLETTWIEPLDL